MSSDPQYDKLVGRIPVAAQEVEDALEALQAECGRTKDDILYHDYGQRKGWPRYNTAKEAYQKAIDEFIEYAVKETK